LVRVAIHPAERHDRAIELDDDLAALRYVRARGGDPRDAERPIGLSDDAACEKEEAEERCVSERASADDRASARHAGRGRGSLRHLSPRIMLVRHTAYVVRG